VKNLIKHYFFDTLYFFKLLITIRTEYTEMSELVWKKLYKISKIIENLKSDRPKSKPFSCHRYMGCSICIQIWVETHFYITFSPFEKLKKIWFVLTIFGSKFYFQNFRISGVRKIAQKHIFTTDFFYLKNLWKFSIF
jgi:hypothetical protein